MGSTRLPDKVMMKVLGKPLLWYVLDRVQQAQSINTIVVATTINRRDDVIETFCRDHNVLCFRGSEDDVLDRYYQCSQQYPNYHAIVRITGDCPLIDPKVIDTVINAFFSHCPDYASNTEDQSFPDGIDVEVFTSKMLQEAARNARLASEREHVTQYIVKNPRVKRINVRAPADFSHFRFTVDNPEDFEVISFIIEHSSRTDSYLDYIALLTKNPEIWSKNTHIERNEGLIKSLREDRVIK